MIFIILSLCLLCSLCWFQGWILACKTRVNIVKRSIGLNSDPQQQASLHTKELTDSLKLHTFEKLDSVASFWMKVYTQKV